MLRRTRLLTLLLISLALVSFLVHQRFSVEPIESHESRDPRDEVYKMAKDWDSYRVRLQNFINDYFPDDIKQQHSQLIHDQVGQVSLKSKFYSFIGLAPSRPEIHPPNLNLAGKSKVKTIMQTGSEDTPFQNSFEVKNPGWNRKFLNDDDAESWVKATFGKSELYDVWKSMRKPVLKADFIRYAWLYFNGGVYSDIDTDCDTPIDKWGAAVEPFRIETQLGVQSISNDEAKNVVIGIEIQAQDRPDWHKYYARPVQFVQWTLVSFSPYHPIFVDTLRSIAEEMKPVREWYKQNDEKNAQISKQELPQARKPQSLHDPFMGENKVFEVLDVTGPGVFTDCVFSYLNTKYGLTWRDFGDLKSAVHIDDITILPKVSFSESPHGSRQLPEVLIWHQFRGSWKKPQK